MKLYPPPSKREPNMVELAMLYGNRETGLITNTYINVTVGRP